MRAYELVFPETADMNPNDVMGPLTARIATVQTMDGRSHNINGNTDLGDISLTSNPITDTVTSYLSNHDVGLRLLFILIGLILLTAAVFRLIK